MRFSRAMPQIIKRINDNAPLMRQSSPDVRYCGTLWPPTFPYRRHYLAIGPVPSLAGPFPCPNPRRESVGGRNGLGLA